MPPFMIELLKKYRRPPHGGRGLKFESYGDYEQLVGVALPTEGVD